MHRWLFFLLLGSTTKFAMPMSRSACGSLFLAAVNLAVAQARRGFRGVFPGFMGSFSLVFSPPDSRRLLSPSSTPYLGLSWQGRPFTVARHRLFASLSQSLFCKSATSASHGARFGKSEHVTNKSEVRSFRVVWERGTGDSGW